MDRKPLFWAMNASAVIGLLVSAYLTYLSFTPPTACIIGEVGIFSCNDVIYSRYADFYGVSVAFLGLSWFIITIGLLALAWRSRQFMQAVVAWSLLGAGGVAAFVYTEVFLLGSICPFCTVAHLAGLVMLVLSIAATRTPHTGASGGA